MSEQEKRLGLNEAMFREINERLEAHSPPTGTTASGPGHVKTEMTERMGLFGQDAPWTPPELVRKLATGRYLHAEQDTSTTYSPESTKCENAT